MLRIYFLIVRLWGSFEGFRVRDRVIRMVFKGFGVVDVIFKNYFNYIGVYWLNISFGDSKFKSLKS